MKRTVAPAPARAGRAKDNVSATRRDIVRRSRIDDPEKRGEEIGFEEVARILGIAVSSVRTLASLGEIPAYRLFRRVKFFRAEIEQYKNNMLRVK